jgi:peptide subunit release factor 1 (eRF1)
MENEERKQIFKYKRMLESLSNAQGTSGATSVVSLLISPTGSTVQMASQLSDKLSTADRIKSCI